MNRFPKRLTSCSNGSKLCDDTNHGRVIVAALWGSYSWMICAQRWLVSRAPTLPSGHSALLGPTLGLATDWSDDARTASSGAGGLHQVAGEHVDVTLGIRQHHDDDALLGKAQRPGGESDVEATVAAAPESEP